MKSKQTVFVGLSGGVDSSVAALRLQNEGCNVVGVFIKVWHPDFMVCNWEQERLDAMRVAAHLEIPFLTCDAEAAYKQEVADYFIAEYQAGRTPNPDVMCNQAVKFGAFVEFAKSHGADYVATGHYAQKVAKGDSAELHRGVDVNKDQTYFLWTLTQAQLDYALFPVGNTPKEAIRKEAETAGIPVAAKRDSQGICFLGQVDIPEFLSHYVNLAPGDVLNTQGQVIGTHQGALVYTKGQRHGFTLTTQEITQKPHYVVATDLNKNTVTVDTQKPRLTEKQTITLTNLNLRADITGTNLQAQFRYRQTPFAVEMQLTEPGQCEITPLAEVDAPAAGQSCVLYDGMHCVGGGMIA